MEEKRTRDLFGLVIEGKTKALMNCTDVDPVAIVDLMTDSRNVVNEQIKAGGMYPRAVGYINNIAVCFYWRPMYNELRIQTSNRYEFGDKFIEAICKCIDILYSDNTDIDFILDISQELHSCYIYTFFK